MACDITGILPKTCEVTNFAGIVKAYAIPADQVVSFGTETAGEIPTITKETGKAFVELAFTKIKGSFGIALASEDVDAPNVSTTTTLFVPLYTPERKVALDSLVGKELVLVVKDKNGQLIIVGDKESPAHFSAAEGGTGTGAAGEVNGLTLTFTTPTGQAFPPFFSGTETDLLTPGV